METNPVAERHPTAAAAVINTALNTVVGAVIGLAFGSILLLVGLSRAAIVWAKGEPVTFRDSLVPALLYMLSLALGGAVAGLLSDWATNRAKGIVRWTMAGAAVLTAIMAVDGTLPWQFEALDWGFVLGCGAVFGCAVGLGLEQL